LTCPSFTNENSERRGGREKRRERGEGEKKRKGKEETN